MPHQPNHRGPDPEDEKLFAQCQWPALRRATADLCWLLNRGYAVASAVELVGNRYELTRRQRIAVSRCACSAEAFQQRQWHQVEPSMLSGQELWLDGYNVLTALEATLSGGFILLGCDGCCRDVVGIHGGYRMVHETIPALQLIGELAAQWAVAQCHWWLDRPISNSGRLKTLICALAANNHWLWTVDLDYNPDRILSQTSHIVASSDSVILDRCQRWFNMVRHIIESHIPQARLIDFSSNAG